MTMTLFSANDDGDHDEYIINFMASTFNYAWNQKTKHMLPTHLK